LSNIKVDELKAGARVCQDEYAKEEHKTSPSGKLGHLRMVMLFGRRSLARAGQAGTLNVAR